MVRRFLRNEGSPHRTRRRAEETRDSGRAGCGPYRRVLPEPHAGFAECVGFGKRFGRHATRAATRHSPLAAANRDLDSVTPMPARRTPRNADSSIQDFKPTLKPPEGTDVSRIDPTLHLDVIAKLRDEPLEGGARSIFDFGAPPAPKTLPVVAPIKPGPGGPGTAKPAPPPTPAAPAKPVIPPIPLKFYGYVDASGAIRRAFFMQGDDIFVAGENDTVNNRYKILHLTANSAIVEDMTTKNQQTLPLVEELPG